MRDRPPDLIVIGPPGSGKSTLAASLAEQLGFVHLSAGALLRKMAAEDPEVGGQIRRVMAEGALAPDELTDELIRRRIEAIPQEQGVILDGYPRSARQAATLSRILAESGRLRRRPLVLRLDVPGDELLERLRRRRDIAGRDDDTDEALRRRLQIYRDEAPGVIDVMSEWADVAVIDGAQPPEAIREEVLEKLNAERAARREPIFVVQAHDARTEHFDFRLEVGGVLKSWAVPKGPSTDPREKRLAIRVEDHPLEYADFEGVIPEGQYGAGPVIVWDTGPYRNRTRRGGVEVPPEQAVDEGHIVVELFGHKLRGGYALTRIGADPRGRERWLLVKKRDEYAATGDDLTASRRESVLSGRTIEQVAAEAA